MKYEATTIKDIAKALGLSTSTVSRALRDSYEISEATKKTVLQYAQSVNYHPNPVALSLKEKRSKTIGVVICEIANSFFSQIIHGIESVAQEKGYRVIIAQSMESSEREMLTLQDLTSHSIDGLIISVSSETKNFAILQELKDRGLPIVFFDRIAEDIHTHKVVVDNFRGAFEATQHLIQQGYRKVAAICNDLSLSIARQRLAGYHAALQQAGIKPIKQLVKISPHGGLIQQEVESAISELLASKHRPDALFTLTDKITLTTLRILKQKGISIPHHIGLMGFSNSDITELLDPPLSIIRQPALEMGKASTELLLQLIESKRPVTDFETRMLRTEMIIRKSSQRDQKTA